MIHYLLGLIKSQLHYTDIAVSITVISAPWQIWTADILLVRQALVPAELMVHNEGDGIRTHDANKLTIKGRVPYH